MFTFLRGLLTFVILLGLSAALGRHFYSAPATTDPFRHAVLRMTVRQIVAQLPAPVAPGLLCISGLAGDQEDMVCHTLLAAIDDSGKYHCVPLAQVRRLVPAGIVSQEVALHTARELGAQWAGWGQLVCFSHNAQGSQVTLRLSILHVADQTALFENRRFSGELRPGFSLAYYRAWLACWGLGSKLLAWLLVTLFLPLVLMHPLTRVLEQESNGYNLLALLGLTAVNTCCAWALAGFSLTETTNSFAILLAFASAAFYNYVVLTWLENQRG